MIGLVLLSIGLVGAIMLAMAVGMLFTGRCLRGSCGGLQPAGPGDETACDTCPMRRPPNQPHG
ncbi:MAG: (Na+)-NQR maturation NqrM [Acidimicrobiales bacterium]|nr:(Na+)-NQR maturation NqrM [Acidimicrobiales bacterium]